jgi:hypothetical protein
VGPASKERFAFPASFYIDAYESYRSATRASDAALENSGSDSISIATRAQLPERKARVKLAIASKGIESIPFVVQMLRSNDAEESQDAVQVLALMGGDSQVIDSLIESITDATDSDAVTTLVTALAATRNPRSIPYLARILEAPGADDAAIEAAVTSLGILANRRLDLGDDPRAAAIAWLTENGHSSAPTVSGPNVSTGPPDNPAPGGHVHVQIHAARRAEHRKALRASTEEARE